MSKGLPQEAITGFARDASVDYFTHHDTYQPFTVNECGRITLGCIEPRDQEGVHHGQFDVVMQGPGGGAGEGLDSGLALTIVNDRLATPETGMDYDKDKRPGLILAGHLDCTFLIKKYQVVSEMANPSEFTIVSAELMARRLGVLALFNKHKQTIMLASEFMREHLNEQAKIRDYDLPEDGDPLLDYADQLHPDSKNVVRVKGKNTARVYVTNYLPNLGKDRNKKSPNPTVRDMQKGYHDGIGADVQSLDPSNTRRMSDKVRQLKLVARIMRSAATRTLITTENRDEMVFLSVMKSRRTKSGLIVVNGLTDKEGAAA